MALEIYRVTVRGHFGALDAETGAALTAAADDHDAIDAAFTADGTFVYDRRLVAFSLRYELRVNADDRAAADVAATEQGLERAEAFLAAHRIGHRGLRVTASNMGDLWRDRDPQRRRA
jgi:hypothetical protein